jgi:hypothetical protein
MDIGKRGAEIANVLCAVLLFSDFGEKHHWWAMTHMAAFVEYAFPFSILLALGLNVWALQRKPKEPAIAGLTNDPSRSEVDRLNQHRVELLGTQIVDLKQQLEDVRKQYFVSAETAETLRVSERQAITDRDAAQKHIANLEKTINEVASRPPSISLDVKTNVGKATLLFEYGGFAEMLGKLLEDTWHHWDNAGEKLVHPLSDSMELKNLRSDSFYPLHRELFEFKVLYKFHLEILERHFPTFSSNATIARVSL